MQIIDQMSLWKEDRCQKDRHIFAWSSEGADLPADPHLRCLCGQYPYGEILAKHRRIKKYEEKMPEFKIEKPGFYKTRDGRKVQIVHIRNDTDQPNKAIGFFHQAHNEEARTWKLNGKYGWNSADFDSLIDIISEWHELQTWEHDVWVAKLDQGGNIYNHIHPIPPPTVIGSPKIIACKKIRVKLVEGSIEL